MTNFSLGRICPDTAPLFIVTLESQQSIRSKRVPITAMNQYDAMGIAHAMYSRKGWYPVDAVESKPTGKQSD
jgi:hypothetical protein